ncbi:phosphoribosylformylglycinamidine synthase subunit PurS [Armatimonadota bacterium]|nr:phosphoribosylformylglycinamidine synthase subunit PurS [Armatimonadota bacterium]GDX39965.1 phosphoribosylformylglycinamidine synthase subunit PurS [Armatimonadota bacterium]
MPQVKVIVTLKPSLLDAQGRVVKDALNNMGYADVQQVRIGKYMEVEVSGESGDLDAEIKAMCEKLLSNPVIEDYRYEVVL